MRAFRDILLALDVPAARALWRKAFPHLYQPANDDETLVMLHEARIQSDTMPVKAKAYSMAFLAERREMERETILAPAVLCSSTSSDLPLKHAVEGAMMRVAEAALTQGMHPEKDAREIQRAMLDARAKVKAGRVSV